MTSPLCAVIDLLAHLDRLYQTYADDLRLARREQARLRRDSPGMKTQLDDVEAELTYLRLREARPASTVEVGCLDGWSTSWILRALRDNGGGELFSFDSRGGAPRHVPPELSRGRWTFVAGDVRRRTDRLPAEIDFLCVAAAHTARFARWYIPHLVERLGPGAPVGVHGVFRRARPLPFGQARVVTSWLRGRDVPHFTASPVRNPLVHRQLCRIRRELGFDAPIHTGSRNATVFFSAPGQDA
ncbi:MAG: class I SAM-dependent methyltransferase [Stackebrandtia sp.]